jgi:hypothetical protein
MNHKNGVMVPYVALSLFTGIRHTELGRLTLDAALQDEEKVINLEGDVAKGRRSRLVDIQKNLPAWIRLSENIPIIGPNFPKDFAKIRELAGFRIGQHRMDSSRPAWAPNLCRHTALSNYFAVTKDEKETARWGGNSPETLHKHYRRNVTQTAAQEFWLITPQSLKAEFGALSEAA